MMARKKKNLHPLPAKKAPAARSQDPKPPQKPPAPPLISPAAPTSHLTAAPPTLRPAAPLSAGAPTHDPVLLEPLKPVTSASPGRASAPGPRSGVVVVGSINM